VQRTVALIPWRNLAKYALAGYAKAIGVAEKTQFVTFRGIETKVTVI